MTLADVLKKYNRKQENITKVYHGKDNWCRCGCGGRYFDKANLGFTRAINLLNKPDRFDFAVRVNEIEAGPTWINIPFGEDYENKCYCIYFD